MWDLKRSNLRDFITRHVFQSGRELDSGERACKTFGPWRGERDSEVSLEEFSLEASPRAGVTASQRAMLGELTW